MTEPTAAKTQDRKAAELRALLERREIEIARRALSATKVEPPAFPCESGARTRHETMFSREIDRAMDRLMKLQQERLKATTGPTTPSTQLHRAG